MNALDPAGAQLKNLFPVLLKQLCTAVYVQVLCLGIVFGKVSLVFRGT
jgi:hypothetical protein